MVDQVKRRRTGIKLYEDAGDAGVVFRCCRIDTNVDTNVDTNLGNLR